MKLLFMKFSLLPCYFVPVKPKYLLHHPLLVYLSPTCLRVRHKKKYLVTYICLFILMWSVRFLKSFGFSEPCCLHTVLTSRFTGHCTSTFSVTRRCLSSDQVLHRVAQKLYIEDTSLELITKGSVLRQNVLYKIGKCMQSNTTMTFKEYLMAILDNYMFRPLLTIFRLSSRELRVLLCTVHCARTWCRDLYIRALLTLATRNFRASTQSIPPHIEITLRNKALCRDLCTTCAHSVYSTTLSSLEDNLKMASEGRNM